MGLTYLASPYSHPDPDVREVRYIAACRAAGKLMLEGVPTFSPIAHTHPIEANGMNGVKPPHDFWMKQDIAILRKCERLVVLCIDGWDRSRGVTEEIHIAQRLGIPVEYMHP